LLVEKSSLAILLFYKTTFNTVVSIYINRSIMKAQEGERGGQGRPTSDRAFFDHKAEKQQKGVSNGGAQKSFQTSNRDNERKVEHRRRPLL
jgi:hypothetical protein